MKVRIRNEQKQVKVNQGKLRKLAREILKDLGCLNQELSILLVDDAQIREINREYLKRDYPTDVLSFALKEGEHGGINLSLLGDVVISPETAQRQALGEGYSLEKELSFLLIHGILHLLGYDHQGSTKKASLMKAKERELWLKFFPNS